MARTMAMKMQVPMNGPEMLHQEPVVPSAKSFIRNRQITALTRPIHDITADDRVATFHGDAGPPAGDQTGDEPSDDSPENGA